MGEERLHIRRQPSRNTRSSWSSIRLRGSGGEDRLCRLGWCATWARRVPSAGFPGRGGGWGAVVCARRWAARAVSWRAALMAIGCAAMPTSRLTVNSWIPAGPARSRYHALATGCVSARRQSPLLASRRLITTRPAADVLGWQPPVLAMVPRVLSLSMPGRQGQATLPLRRSWRPSRHWAWAAQALHALQRSLLRLLQ